MTNKDVFKLGFIALFLKFLLDKDALNNKISSNPDVVRAMADVENEKNRELERQIIDAQLELERIQQKPLPFILVSIDFLLVSTFLFTIGLWGWGILVLMAFIIYLIFRFKDRRADTGM